MKARVKIHLLSTVLTAALACNAHAESRLIDLNTGTFFDGIVSTKPLCTVSQDADGITVSYQFDYAELSDSNDAAGAFSWGGEGLSVCANPGEPAIVATRDIFNITNYADVNIELTGASYIDLPYELAPTPYPVIGSLETPPTEPIQPYAGYFPIEILNTSDSYNIKDGRYIDVDLCAIQYNYTAKTIRAYKSVTYRITPKNSGNVMMRAASVNTEPMWLDENMESFVSNPGSLTTPYLTESTSDQLSMLLVTSKSLEAVTKEYADYKRTLGIRTHMIVLERGGDTLFEDVKQLINDKLSEDKSICYVLIVGDLSHVTSKVVSSGFVSNATDHDGSFHDSDLYYFIYSNDKIYTPSLPSVNYGRIPLSTVANVATVFDKIKRYELSPVQNNKFYDNALIMSYFEREDPDDDTKKLYEHAGYRHVEAAYHLTEALKNIHSKSVTSLYYIDDNVGHEKATPKYYAKFGERTDSLLPSYLQKISSYNSGVNIRNLLNSSDGYGCMLYLAHGHVDKTVSGDFSTTGISELNNGDKTPVVFGTSCLLGRYRESDNFAKKFLGHSNGGCVSIIAATNSTPAYANSVFANSLLDCIYPGVANTDFVAKTGSGIRSLRIGSVMDYAQKVVFANTTKLPTTSSLSWIYPGAAANIFEMYHCFGDPTMRIRTKKPISVSKPTVYVKKDATNGYRLTVYSPNGQEYSVCEEGQQPIRSNESIFDLQISDPTKVNYTICINGDNMIPYYRTLTIADVRAMSYKMSATYNTASRTISVSYTPPANRAYAWVEAYDSDGRYIGSTPHVVANGTTYNGTISVSSLSLTRPYILCLMLDGESIYSIKVS